MALFEDEDKSRLFETHERSTRSIRDYLKVLLPVVLVVVLIGAAVIYFGLPDVGDEVKSPRGLDDAIKLYFLDKEKRSVMEASYYYCSDFYWVRLGLEKRPDITARQMDEGKRRVIAVERANGAWEISSTPVGENEADIPCTR